MAKRVTPGSTAKHIGVAELHGIKVGESLTQNVEGHPPRADSPEFVKARATLHKILAELGDNFYGHGDGKDSIQAHHGGSLWCKADEGKWVLFINIAGVEWNEQFSAAFEKIDLLRQNAKRMVDAFPKTRQALKDLGYDPDPVLDTPVTDAESCSRYVDSLWNSCVPLPQKVHTGTLSDKDERSCGIHNYPLPAWNLNFLARPDFKPFVKIGKVEAVVGRVSHDPADKRVRLLGVHGDRKHPLHRLHQDAEAQGKAVVLEEHDPVSKAAFLQTTAPPPAPTPST
jgi:hypothetical protein